MPHVHIDLQHVGNLKLFTYTQERFPLIREVGLGDVCWSELF